MPRNVGSDRDRDIYRAYDGRIITRRMIDTVISELETRHRRRARLQQLRIWGLVALLMIVLIAAAVVLVWWRLTTPM